MKKHLRILILLAWVVTAQAQGTLKFSARLTGADEVPPNNDPTIGTGTFWLTGDSLSFLVNIPAVTFTAQSAYIQGPALPGAEAPIVFDLGGPVFHSGNSLGAPPFYSFGSPASPPFGAGPFTLTEEQIVQLESGLCYVHVTSFTQPDGQLRGQILLSHQFTVCLRGSNEVPPNTEQTVGKATFTLTGHVLDFYVAIPAESFVTTGGTINGPALAGSNGPIIFDLGAFLCHDGGSTGDPPFCESASPGAVLVGAGPFRLTDEQLTQLQDALWYVNITSAMHPNGALRGQMLPADGDGDGVPDDQDECPNTAPGAVVDANGCSLDQLCPCDGNWRSHAQYLSCLIRVTRQFQRQGLITASERRAIVREALRSDCGKPVRKRWRKP